MRASSDYFDDFDDAVFRGPSRVQRMIAEQRHRVKKMKASNGFGPGDEWDDEWRDDDYGDEYSDYNEDEFDGYGVSR